MTAETPPDGVDLLAVIDAYGDACAAVAWVEHHWKPEAIDKLARERDALYRQILDTLREVVK